MPALFMVPGLIACCVDGFKRMSLLPVNMKGDFFIKITLYLYPLCKKAKWAI